MIQAAAYLSFVTVALAILAAFDTPVRKHAGIGMVVGFLSVAGCLIGDSLT